MGYSKFVQIHVPFSSENPTSQDTLKIPHREEIAPKVINYLIWFAFWPGELLQYLFVF